MKRARASDAAPQRTAWSRNASTAASRDAVIGAIVIVLSSALAYSNTLDASFHWDDFQHIVHNDAIRDLRAQWLSPGRRWLGYLSFALNYRFGGLNPFGYHLANLVIHVCNGLLVSFLTATTLRTPAVRTAEAGPLLRRYLPLSAGLLFALHPIATQAVTYVVQRFASLATLFYLLSLLLYVQARLSLESDHRSKIHTAGLYGLSLVAAAAAMKTKEISFTLPFVAATYELLFFRPPRRRLLLVGPLAAAALLVPLGLAAPGGNLADVLGDPGQFAAESSIVARPVYLLTQARVVVTYLRLLLLPIRQNVDHDYRLSSSLLDPGVLLAIAVLLAVVGLAAFLLVRASRANGATGRLVCFGVAWFFLTLSVESSFVPIRDVIFEHRVYLPSAGAAVSLGAALLWAIERLHLSLALPTQAALALLLTAGPLGAATYARNLVWKDDVTLWRDAVAKSPDKARPHVNLGAAYGAKGLVDDAMREYREAARLAPVPEAHSSLAAYHLAKGQVDDAIREYREAVRLKPTWAEVHFTLGFLLAQQGRPAEAVEEYRRALDLEASPETVLNLAVALDDAGRPQAAIAEFERFLELAGEREPDRAEQVRARLAQLRAPPAASSRSHAR